MKVAWKEQQKAEMMGAMKAAKMVVQKAAHWVEYWVDSMVYCWAEWTVD